MKGARELVWAAECERGGSRLPRARVNGPEALGFDEEDQLGNLEPLPGTVGFKL